MQKIIPVQKVKVEFEDTLVFLDKRGHTDKSQTEYNKHKQLKQLKRIVNKDGEKYGYFITEKPCTIVNKGYFGHIEEIVERSYKLWDELNYRQDSILYRTGSFTQRQGLLTSVFPNKSTQHTKQKIKEFIEQTNNPVQFLLHPLPSQEFLIKNFIAARASMLNGVLKFEMGIGGITQTNELEQGDIVISGEMFAKPTYKVIKGKLDERLESAFKATIYGLYQFSIHAPGVVVPNWTQGKSPMVYEFRSFINAPHTPVTMEFLDYEVFR